MRTLIVLALSTTLIASTAFAADVAPLPAGKPAGIKQAQMGTTGWVLIGAAAIVAIGAVAVSSNGSTTQANPGLAVTSTTI